MCRPGNALTLPLTSSSYLLQIYIELDGNKMLDSVAPLAVKRGDGDKVLARYPDSRVYAMHMPCSCHHMPCICHAYIHDACLVKVALEIQMAMEEAQALQQSNDVQHMHRS